MPDALVRGLALFFGSFGLVSAVSGLARGAASQNIWWIDLSALSPGLGAAFEILASALLLAWSLGARSNIVRRGAVAASLLLALVAAANAVSFYRVWSGGSIAPAMPLPVSAVYLLGFVWIAVRAHRGSPDAGMRSGYRGVATALLACVIAFPLLQVAFFGTTDYRRNADVAVVLGARVYDNGVLTTALRDRVRTGADLYRAGLVSRLVMSGGVEPNGIDETVAMQKAAVAMGVPQSAITLDAEGDNTDATVTNTTAILRSQGATRVLVVSQFWHLPRIKLAYLSAGWNVETVPATASAPIIHTPYLIAREVPAFWQYWLRSLLPR